MTTTTKPRAKSLVLINDTKMGFEVHGSRCPDVKKKQSDLHLKFKAATVEAAADYAIDDEMREQGWTTDHVRVMPCTHLPKARKFVAPAADAAQEETTAHAIAIEPPADADTRPVAAFTKARYARRGVTPGTCPDCLGRIAIWKRGRAQYVGSCDCKEDFELYDPFDAARMLLGLTWPAYAAEHGKSTKTAHAIFDEHLQG